MSSFDAVRFVEWAVWYANQRGASLTPIRIVKFLYLLDVYNARISTGKPLTGWQWRFVHYGPFCGEALDTISDAESKGLIHGEAYKGRLDKETRFYRHSAEEIPEPFPTALPHYVCSQIKHAVETWADDTYGLLNHVYFHTEPMIHCRPYEALDFAQADMPSKEKPIEMKPLPDKKLKRARQLLQELQKEREERGKRLQSPLSGNPYDESYYEALRAIESDESSVHPFSGTLDLRS